MITIFPLLLLVFLAGCRSAESYRLERIEKATKHFESIRLKQLDSGRVLTLPDCIGMALAHNLDLNVSRLQERIASEQITAEVLGMLPEFSAVNNWKDRNNVPASSSQSVSSGGATYNYSQSSPQWENNIQLELALSVLDFGLAYLNSAQAQDRSFVESEQTRRAAQNLTLEVVKAYFKVAVAQQAMQRTTALLDQCAGIEEDIKFLYKTGEVSPFILIDEHKRFIRIQQRLMESRKFYQDGCIELRALLGVMPTSDVAVDDSVLKQLPDLRLPEISDLEKAALLERPELSSKDIQQHIMLTESRKTLLTMLPNVRIFLDFTNSTNPFLYHASWMELGVRAAYNLLKLPQQIAKYRTQRHETASIEEQTVALSVAVLAQVRLAHANIAESKKLFELDDKVYQVYQKHLEVAEESFKLGGALSKLELDRLRMETVET
ncbi:MAG: TolC family protein, partial [Victivallaceae bacterium]|nr:TolC family protein [Victivallaceae bacterium]